MLATAPDALEADFQRFYGLDTDLIWTGELPANLAAALAANLSLIHISEPTRP